MPADTPKTSKYPLLENIFALKGLPLRGVYTLHHVAEIFGVTIRAIQDRLKKGDLESRDLPGHAKFLSIDLEAFLENSLQKPTRAS